MGHFARLQLVGRVTYYLGWISLLLGGLVHLNIARSLFRSYPFLRTGVWRGEGRLELAGGTPPHSKMSFVPSGAGPGDGAVLPQASAG